MSGVPADRRRAVTDPACSLAPKHSVVESALREANAGASAMQQPAAHLIRATAADRMQRLWSYRRIPNGQENSTRYGPLIEISSVVARGESGYTSECRP